MTAYTKHFAEDRRLTLLLILEKSPEYTANDYVLRAALSGYGHSISLDLLGTDIAWLAEQGLVQVNAAGAMRVATLTGRGEDVAAGRATVPGVKRPSPGGD